MDDLDIETARLSDTTGLPIALIPDPDICAGKEWQLSAIGGYMQWVDDDWEMTWQVIVSIKVEK